MKTTVKKYKKPKAPRRLILKAPKVHKDGKTYTRKVKHKKYVAGDTEQQWKHCKVCGELKLRINAGTFGTYNEKNKKDKRWVDVEGKQWMGQTCPPCNVERAKAYQKQRLEKKKGS